MKELGEAYSAETEVIRSRIRELREELKAIKSQKNHTEAEDKRAYALARRIAALEPMLRATRELAAHTSHYYDRGMR